MTRIERDPAALSEYVEMIRRNRFSLGFVPTMGALHEGHLSLVRQSVRDNDRTIVSVYVNPLQFGPGEDFERYPRTLDRDVALCEQVRADVVFAPSVRDLQPPGRTTVVTVRGISEDFEGAHRPGHFDGVATVVAHLFNIVRPNRAYFGQKDYQQTLVIRRMVKDLMFPLDVVVCPIARDDDGLALSSRNRFLTDDDRSEALRLPRALVAAEEAVLAGETDGDRIRAIMAEMLASPRDDVEMEYADVVHADTLAPLPGIQSRAVLIAVLRVGGVRLLDNRVIAVPGTAAWER